MPISNVSVISGINIGNGINEAQESIPKGIVNINKNKYGSSDLLVGE